MRLHLVNAGNARRGGSAFTAPREPSAAWLPRFFAVVMLAAVSGCANRASKLPTYDHVPAFTMSDAFGRDFQSSDLAGKVWVADFIYTTCPAECPLMSAKMHAVEKQLPGGDDVRLVSVSVDPARDSPPVLKQFAAHYGAPNDRWIFLTGTPAVVHLLAFTTFHVGDIIDKMQHSTKFVLVDRRGFIRGYYSSLDEEGVQNLLADVEALRKNKS